jgi:hypothetical protein
VPGAGHDGELLSLRERALLTVEHKRDPTRPDLYVLGKVVVHVLAAGDKAARFDREVGDDARAPLSAADSTIMAFSPLNGFQMTSPARTEQDYSAAANSGPAWRRAHAPRGDEQE